ncbi:hypothetical protein T265_00285 [Opisthorchis viverrini]|uniref:Uncharacterized protein n=1 Tax=Opisthorchis viverrini TaxID=6198 RepID=A0A075A286_OPIVI|nr:hypothetical protein T265_00285 [Opisthorchis viverrini]KER33828.1 hypothetical protein T265_00285 [Opisthorchis viverrini]
MFMACRTAASAAETNGYLGFKYAARLKEPAVGNEMNIVPFVGLQDIPSFLVCALKSHGKRSSKVVKDSLALLSKELFGHSQPRLSISSIVNSSCTPEVMDSLAMGFRGPVADQTLPGKSKALTKFNSSPNSISSGSVPGKRSSKVVKDSLALLSKELFGHSQPRLSISSIVNSSCTPEVMDSLAMGFRGPVADQTLPVYKEIESGKKGNMGKRESSSALSPTTLTGDLAVKNADFRVPTAPTCGRRTYEGFSVFH